MTARLSRPQLPDTRQEITHYNNNIPSPIIQQDLLAYLRMVFPIHVSRDLTIRDYDRMAGQQELIDHLQSIHDQQDGG